MGPDAGPTTLPSLTFEASATVPGGSVGSHTVTADGSSAPFHVPCATAANLRPLAVAGGPAYSATAGAATTLDGAGWSDPEGSALSYRWDFGDGARRAPARPRRTSTRTRARTS